MDKKQQKTWHEILMLGKEIETLSKSTEQDWDKVNEVVNYRTQLLKSFFQSAPKDVEMLENDLHIMLKQSRAIEKKLSALRDKSKILLSNHSKLGAYKAQQR